MRHTLVIAEAGVNHNGSVELALDLVDAAADAGADVVKFQTFEASLLATADAPQAAYQREREPRQSQIEMLRGLQLDRAAHERLAGRCAERSIEFLSTAFDPMSLGWLEELGIQRVKVPSGELTNGPLLLTYARTGLPLLVSTGMANLGEVEAALAVIAYGRRHPEGIPAQEELRDAYDAWLREPTARIGEVLLHCTSSYPAPTDEVHLGAMDTLAQAFDSPVGYSDHTQGVAVSIAAVARGAVVIEKHVTLGRDLPGPDHEASLEPSELTEMVAAIRSVERALGTPGKHPTAGERDTRVTSRRSVVAACGISRGERFDESNLTCRRPGTGRSPMDLWRLIGRSASRDYRADELIDDSE